MFTRHKDKTILSFSGSPTVALARLLLESTPGVQCSETLLRSSPTLQTLQTLQTLPTRPFASVHFDPLAWSSGSDQRRISGCGIRWLLGCEIDMFPLDVFSIRNFNLRNLKGNGNEPSVNLLSLQNNSTHSQQCLNHWPQK